MRARLITLALPVLTACSLLYDWDRFAADPLAPQPPDATATDGADAPDAPDAELGVAEPVYHSFSDETRWETFDLKNVDVAAVGYGGGASDGRHVYLAPKGRVAVRHDPNRPLTDPASWEAVRLPALAKEFYGGVFDGRYLYFGAGVELVVARFDTQASFQDPSAWAFFPLTPFFDGLDAGAPADFRGILWPGGDEILLVPSDPRASGRVDAVVRYRRSGDFTDAASWSFERVGGASAAFYGAAAVGDVTVLSPSERGPLARSKPDGGWAVFLPSTLQPSASFYGAVSDGRYVYLVPAAGSPAARLDPTLALAGLAAWTFSTVPVDSGIDSYGGAFDGRHLYFAPADPVTIVPVVADSGADAANDAADAADGEDSAIPDSGALADAAPIRLARYTRYDTTQEFDAPAAWSRSDLQPSPGNTSNNLHRGAIFEGRYVYFSPPLDGSYVVRFHARTIAPGAPLPPGHGRYTP